ncbi:MAG: STAS domain-containing protein [Patescibacteria group bacterium]
MQPNLTIDISTLGDFPSAKLVKFKGDFDKAGYGENKESIDAAVKDSEEKYLVFDFSELKFINSEGIGYLIEVHTHLVQRGRKLVVFGLLDHVMDVFKTIGIENVIPIYTTLNDFIVANK